MNAQLPRCYIHYDPERIDYTLSEQELNELKDLSENNWKDFCIGCLGVGIPCAINAAVFYFDAASNNTTPSFSFNLNLIFAILGIVLGIAFLLSWIRTQKKSDKIVEKIKAKPRMQFPMNMQPVGQLPENNFGIPTVTQP
ncbi:hypothetical protein CHISP_0889 [Chitinispirillum alkaliphilum]|nr:hypothetical protein CHISP_0889 [Chitinispirillum alkaliphilum]